MTMTHQDTIHGFPVIMASKMSAGGNGTRPHRVILVERDESHRHRWVTAIHCESDQEWSTGNYFASRVDAVNDFNRRCNRIGL